MGVRNRNEESVRSIHLLVKLFQSVLGKVDFVEYKIHVLLSMLDIHPEDVDWETKLSKVITTLDQSFRRVVFPFAEMEP